MKTETGITNIVTHMYISNPISPATAITMMVNNLVDKLLYTPEHTILQVCFKGNYIQQKIQ
jgi:hypothetical protein